AGVGSVRFQPEIGGRKSKVVEFTDVLHVPELGGNLLAVLYLTRNCGYHVSIDDTTMHFMRGKEIVFTATINDQNAAYLNGTTLTASMEQAHYASTLPLDYSLWHRRLAHHNVADVKRDDDDPLAGDHGLAQAPVIPHPAPNPAPAEIPEPDCTPSPPPALPAPSSPPLAQRRQPRNRKPPGEWWKITHAPPAAPQPTAPAPSSSEVPAPVQDDSSSEDELNM